ncbi:MAG TPA: hypothetical protein VFF30_06770 [Nitrososphaerales archaeon]|nr:hypothetical protein [Nitrososphaerales archaeon]
MPIEFKAPWPPTFHDPVAFYVGMAVGFVVVLLTTLLADRLGTYMFHRGYAKPFYIKGRRIHHFWIKLFVPLGYVVFCVLLLTGYVLPIWSGMYVRLFSVLAVAVVCICVDSLGDKRWPRIRKDQILHHEWVYALIFLYIIQFVVEVRI